MSRRLDERLFSKAPVVVHDFNSNANNRPGQLYDISPTHFRADFLEPLSTSKRYRFSLNLFENEAPITGNAVIERAIPQDNPALHSYVFAIETMPKNELDHLLEAIEESENTRPDRRSNDESANNAGRRSSDSTSENIKTRRIVITGIGIVSPNAIGKDAFWRAIAEKKTGIKLLDAFDHTPFPIKIAGQVDDAELDKYISKRKSSRMGRATLLGWLAARLAVEDAGIQLDNLNKDRVGVAMGTTLGALDWAFEQYTAHQDQGYQAQHPYTIAAGSCNAISGEIAVDQQLRGISATFSQGCSSASVAISYGMDLIQLGRAEAMLVGGTDAPLNPAVFGAFVKSGILAKSVPWVGNGVITENECTGCVLSEGSCVLLIESYDQAQRRGAKIYGELISTGVSSEGYHMLFPHPSGRGMVVAMREALAAAKLTKDRIDLVMAHIAGMREGYDIEMRLLHREFNSMLTNIAITNVKSLIGYTQGACGAFEVAAACLALREPVDWITYGASHAPTSASKVLINCMGFGGKNVCIILGKL